MDGTEDIEVVRKRERHALPSASEMERHINESRADRRRIVQMWSICLDFLSGDQYRLDRTIERAINPVLNIDRDARVRLVRNQLLPIYRTTAEMLASRYPALTALPTAATWEGIQQSIATQTAMKALWTLNNMQQQLDKAVQYLSPAGNVGLHTFYCPQSRTVKIETVSPFNVLAEKGAENLDESRWGAVRRIYTKADLIEQFPDHEQFILEAKPMDDQDFDESKPMNQARIHHRLPVFYVYYYMGHEKPLQGILLRNKWLWKGEMPPRIKALHIARFTPIVGRFYGMSQIEPLLDPQRAYNEFVNFAIDVARMTSNPVWVVPTDAGVSANDITNSPGAVIRYNGHANPPVRQPAPAVPPHLFDLQGRSLAEMQDLAGIHSASMGKRATGIVSNVAMEQLASRDSGQLYLVRSELEFAIVNVMKDALTLWRYYMPDEVAVAMMDERIGSMVNETVRNSDLLAYPQVLIEPGTMFQAVKRDRDERILELASGGFIDPQEAIREISLPMREMQALNKAAGLRHAKWLLDQCRAGKFVKILPEDDVESIAQVFKEFLNSPEYYKAYEKAQQMATVGLGDPMEVQLQMNIANYIRLVYVEVTTPLDQPPQVIQNRMQQSISPRNQPQALPVPQQMPGGTQGQQQAGFDRQQAVQAARQQPDQMRGAPGVSGSLG